MSLKADRLRVLEQVPSGKNGRSGATIAYAAQLQVTVVEDHLRRLMADGQITRTDGLYRRKVSEPVARAVPAAPAVMEEHRRADQVAIAAAEAVVVPSVDGRHVSEIMTLDQLQAEVAAAHTLQAGGRLVPLPSEFKRQLAAHQVRRCAQCPPNQNLHPHGAFVTNSGAEIPYCQRCWTRYQEAHAAKKREGKTTGRRRRMQPEAVPMQPATPAMHPKAPDMQPGPDPMQLKAAGQAAALKELQAACDAAAAQVARMTKAIDVMRSLLQAAG